MRYDDPFDGSDLIVQGMNSNGEDTAGFTINMDTERITVPDGESITDYYYTSGNKWVKFKSDDISKIFKKNNGGFKIAKKSDTNQIDLESIVSFGDIAARPKLKNIAINYSLCADPTGATTGAWTLTQKNSAATLTGIELATSKDKKNPGVQSVCIWIPATDKKPATQVQEYKLAVRAELRSQVLAGANGRVSLPKTLEVYNAARGKWGSLPRFTAATVLEDAVRLKSTARATGIDDWS